MRDLCDVKLLPTVHGTGEAANEIWVK